ncbi:MAG: hypothetical protein LPJ89_00830 [Hymenobacteraceae bacterium]|nr:hypothetical protein [Hymenobacteraceae bacterium]
MLYATIVLFIMAAIMGAYMFTMVLSRRPRPNWTLLLHGAFAATAISLLIYYSAMHTEESAPTASIVFFILAVFGGFIMLIIDKVMSRRVPVYFPLLHAGAAVTGLVLLVIYVINHS